MKDNDELDEIKEGQDNQHNTGYWYWVNNFSSRYPPKRSKGIWFLRLIDVFFIVPTFILSLVAYFIDRKNGDLVSIGLFGVASVLAILRALRFQPLPETKSQIEIEELRREKKEKKKKFPKRRKDYN